MSLMMTTRGFPENRSTGGEGIVWASMNPAQSEPTRRTTKHRWILHRKRAFTFLPFSRCVSAILAAHAASLLDRKLNPNGRNRSQASRGPLCEPICKLATARLASRLRDSAEALVAAQQQIAGMQGFPLERGTVAWDQKPVPNLTAEQFNRAERRKLPPEAGVGRIGGFRQNKPDAVVLGRLLMIPEHADNPIAQVNGKAGEHAP